jgi:hypothetical protein
LLKLYPPGAVPNVLPAPDVKHEPVIAETYDEVVFTDPNEPFYRQLTRIADVPPIESSSQQALFKDKHYADQEDFVALIGAQTFLHDELASIKERFQVVSEELATVDQTLLAAQQQQREQAASSSSTNSKRTNSNRVSSSGNAASQRKPRPPSQNKKAKP